MNYYNDIIKYETQLAEVQAILNGTSKITSKTTKNILITLINSPDISDDLLDTIIDTCRGKRYSELVFLESARVSLYVYTKFKQLWEHMWSNFVPLKGRINSDVALYLLQKSLCTGEEPSIMRTLVYSNRLVNYYVENNLKVDSKVVLDELCKYTESHKIERIDLLGISNEDYVRSAVCADNVVIFEKKCYGMIDNNILIVACAFLCLLSTRSPELSKCFTKVCPEQANRVCCRNIESTTTFLYSIIHEDIIIETMARYIYHPKILTVLVKLRGAKFEISFLITYIGRFPLEDIFGTDLKAMSAYMRKKVSMKKTAMWKCNNIVNFDISDEIIEFAIEKDCIDMLKLYLIINRSISHKLLVLAVANKSNRCKDHILGQLSMKAITIDSMIRCIEECNNYMFTLYCYRLELYSTEDVPRKGKKYDEFRRAYDHILSIN